MSCISACLSSSLQLEARWSPLTCILQLTPTLTNTTGITPAFNSVDVCFRADNQINYYSSVLLPLSKGKYLKNPVFVAIFLWVNISNTEFISDCNPFHFCNVTWSGTYSMRKMSDGTWFYSARIDQILRSGFVYTVIVWKLQAPMNCIIRTETY